MTPLKKSRKPVPLTGTITMPGDKSISHRALMLSALAPGRSSITGLNDGDDVARTRAALQAYGLPVAGSVSSGRVEVEGSPVDAWREPSDVIAAGNSGSTARMLAGIAATVPVVSVLTGDASLSRRPMLRVVAPLRAMGATIDGRDHADHLPLTIRGTHLLGCDHELAIASAQVKSALLFAGLAAEGTTSVTEPHASRDHTERMLRAAGVELTITGTTVSVAGGQAPGALGWEVPGDVSAAAFFVVAATLLAGSDLTITDVGLNPTRTGALDFLRAMGADIEVGAPRTPAGEPVGEVRVRATSLGAAELAADRVPSTIDEIPILAVAATQADGTSVFRGVGELRAKESDRVAALVAGLSALGAEARAEGDELVIEGPSRLGGGIVESHGDHRIAMAFAVAGLISDAPVKVKGWSSVETSFPSFLEVLGKAQRGSK
jgi:3-phosphoshikimate 1-carboxyvinyltransferase